MNAIQIRSGTSGAVLEGTNANDVPLWHPATRTWQAGAVPPPTPADLGQLFVIDSYAKLEELFPADQNGVHVLNELAQYFFSDVVVMAADTRISVTAPSSLITGPGMIASTSAGAVISIDNAGSHHLVGLTIQHPTPDDGGASAVYVGAAAARVVIDSCVLTVGALQAAAVSVAEGDAVVTIQASRLAGYSPVQVGGAYVVVSNCDLEAGDGGASVSIVEPAETVLVTGCRMNGGAHGVYIEDVQSLEVVNCYLADCEDEFIYRVGPADARSIVVANCYVVGCHGFLNANTANQPNLGYKLLFNTTDMAGGVFATGVKTAYNSEPNVYRGNTSSGAILLETPIQVI